jgi:hypothetical protein
VIQHSNGQVQLSIFSSERTAIGLRGGTEALNLNLL